ncbi:MAG: helix-turn-helix transcriptional regulator [Desulfatiglandaceae bacterium]
MDDAFGQILRKRRIDSGLGLRELARRINKSPGYLSDVEKGHVPPPSEAVILDIAAALAIEKKDLLVAARKVDPEVSDYVAQKPEVADFLRMARDEEFEQEDWERITQLARIAKLGKREKENQ